MITNPAAAIKVLITYAIIIPVAIFVGWLLTNPLDYGTLGYLGVILALLFMPIFIKWHYPLMIFALASPIVCFFLIGRPPFGEVMVAVSLGIAIVERAMNSDRRFLKVSALTWPLLFLAAVIFLTMELTGGFQLNTLHSGAGGGGGRKYVALFLGIATYFALTSRPIPTAKRRFYVMLFFLPGVLAFIGDMFPYLPPPLNYINLLIPPTSGINPDVQVTIIRLGALATAAGAMVVFMMARYGLRGIFMQASLWRAPFFLVLLALALAGGFRVIAIGFCIQLTLMFFLEKLHRTRLLLVFLFGGVLAAALLVPLANKLPLNIQRSISFLPLEVDPVAKFSAQDSAEWRYRIWRDTWPKVPQYLVLGKGYELTADDFAMMGTGTFANTDASKLDASQESLAISGDYHNGPLSTLMPFGLWGGFGAIWLMAACLWVHYRNYKYSPPDLKTVNTLLLVLCLQHIVTFFFIFGGFAYDVGEFTRRVGFCIALNGGVLGAKRVAVAVQTFKALPAAQPA